MSYFNNKQFLQVIYPNEASNKISVVFLDLNLNKVQHINPSQSHIIYNLTGFPEQWMFLKKGKQKTISLENSQSTDAIIIEFIEITKGEKIKKNNTTNKDKILSATRIMARTPPK